MSIHPCTSGGKDSAEWLGRPGRRQETWADRCERERRHAWPEPIDRPALGASGARSAATRSGCSASHKNARWFVRTRRTGAQCSPHRHGPGVALRHARGAYPTVASGGRPADRALAHLRACRRAGANHSRDGEDCSPARYSASVPQYERPGPNQPQAAGYRHQKPTNQRDQVRTRRGPRVLPPPRQPS